MAGIYRCRRSPVSWSDRARGARRDRTRRKATPRQYARSARPWLEPLETRLALASDLQNPVEPLDVNADTFISPFDALLIINRLNQDGGGPISTVLAAEQTIFFDVNGNGSIDPGDVLRVVNHLNQGPMIGRVYVTAPETGVRGQPLEFHLATKLLGHVDYRIDWSGDGTPDQTVRGSAQGVTVQHAFNDATSYQIEVSVDITKAGEAFTASATTALVIDVLELDGGDLRIGGTVDADTIHLEEQPGGHVVVDINGQQLDSPGPVTGRVVVYAHGGHDTVDASGLTLAVELHGGKGHDVLVGGSADDVLLGGRGNDVLNGHSGRDLLIGGDDADELAGGADEDILVGGTTSHDKSSSALAEIIAQWTTSEPLEDRVTALKRAELNLTTDTVFEDSAIDQLDGEMSGDWFLATALDTTDRAFDEPYSNTPNLVNIAVTTDPNVQLMPSIAVNPLEPDHIVVAYMDYSLVNTGMLASVLR
jgi:hypothetical protein